MLVCVMKRLFTLKPGGLVTWDGFTVDETDADVEAGCLPFTVDTGLGVADTEPNRCGTSVLIGGTEAGEEEIVAAASSMEPKVTGDAATIQNP